jgi:hypothetical protein
MKTATGAALVLLALAWSSSHAHDESCSNDCCVNYGTALDEFFDLDHLTRK